MFDDLSGMIEKSQARKVHDYCDYCAFTSNTQYCFPRGYAYFAHCFAELYLSNSNTKQEPSRRRRALSRRRAFMGARGKERRSSGFPVCHAFSSVHRRLRRRLRGPRRDDDDRRPLRSFASGTRPARVVSRVNACARVRPSAAYALSGEVRVYTHV